MIKLPQEGQSEIVRPMSTNDACHTWSHRPAGSSLPRRSHFILVLVSCLIMVDVQIVVSN
jgi:hypothetical protein